VAEARAAKVPAVVFTFEPHPAAVLRPDGAPDRILDFQRKLDLLADLEVDAVVCPDGPLSVLAMEPGEFVRRIIAEAIGAALVIEGPDFRFGRKQGGDMTLMARMAEDLGFRVESIGPVTVDGEVVSSTRIRAAVSEGRVAEACRLLGRPFEFVGKVVHGRQHGRQMGYPTINLAGGDFLVPGDGVYAGWADLADGDGRRIAAAISVGCEPTFGALAHSVVEAYLLDFQENLYGQAVRLEFLERLRGQETFATVEDLAQQMGHDCEAVRQVLSGDATAGQGKG
jgi:riboflavin kinase/FMN adenylyltransferase